MTAKRYDAPAAIGNRYPLGVSFSDAEKNTLDAAAEAVGVSRAELIRHAALVHAMRVLKITREK